MIDWIYSNPTWLWGALMVAAVTAIACAGLLAAQRLIPIERRRPYNDVVGMTLAIIGIAYAVLVAFIAVATWEQFTAADKVADTEASLVSDLYRDATGLSAEKAAPIRDGLKRYLDQVVGAEWEGQKRGRADGRPGWAILEAVHVAIASLNAQSPSEAVIQAELLRTLNELYNARRSRMLAADASIPAVVWSIIIIGTAITIVYTYLFGVSDLRMHMAITGLIAAAMTLVIVLVVSLDRPFRGDLSVSPAPYDIIRANIAEMAAQR